MSDAPRHYEDRSIYHLVQALREKFDLHGEQIYQKAADFLELLDGERGSDGLEIERLRGVISEVTKERDQFRKLYEHVEAMYGKCSIERGEAHAIIRDVRQILKADNAIEGAQALAAYAELLHAALEKAYRELNEIHARDGVPYTHYGMQASVDQAYFTSVVEECRDVLAKHPGSTPPASEERGDSSGGAAKPSSGQETLPNIRILHRGAPDSVVIRFARDITNEEVEAVGKVWVAAQRDSQFVAWKKP